MKKIDLFLQTQEKLDKFIKSRPDNLLIKSASLQLQYLIDLEMGHTFDRSRLQDINLGLIAVREIEGSDDDLAEFMYRVSNIACRVQDFNEALQELQAYMRTHAGSPALESVQAQLLYLIDLESGKTDDDTKLNHINLALTEGDVDNEDVLYLLEKAGKKVQEMISERRSS